MTSSIRCGRSLRRITAFAATVMLLVSFTGMAGELEQEIRVRVKLGERAYDLAQFQEALQDFTDAYRLKPLPGLLFNIAQCERQLGHYDRAAFFYRRFLSLAHPNEQVAATTRSLIAEAEHKQKEASSQAAVVPPATAGGTSSSPVDLRPHPTEPVLSPVPVAQQQAAPAERHSLLTRWWFWTGVGVIATGVAAGSVALATRPATGTLQTISAR